LRLLMKVVPVLTLILVVGFLFTWSMTSEDKDKAVLSSTKEPKRILYWTPFFGEKAKVTLDDCPLRNACTITSDRDGWEKADAVIFHISDFKPNDVPMSRSPNQRYVFLSMEAPPSLTTRDVPLGFFNGSQTHLLNSRVPFPYGGWWLSPEIASGLKPNQLHRDNLEVPSESQLLMKNSTIFWLVSNCKTPSRREEIIAALSREIAVDIYGACATEDRLRLSNCARDDQMCLDGMFQRYFFYLALENNVCKDYITEKYWDRYRQPAVPIVLRRWTYEKRLPAKSFIAIDDYRNATEMATHLYRLMNNPVEYLEYFAYRRQGYATAEYNAEGYRLGNCRLCEELLKAPSDQMEMIPDVIEWFTKESGCEKDTFAKEWLARSAG